MSVNTMTIEQANAFLSSIVAQMQGGALVSVNTGNFTSVAQNCLRAGTEPLLGAISQVLTRTIFSNRPYRGKFSGLMMNEQRFGAMTRKINYIDTPLEPDQQLYKTGTTPYVDGDVPTPDMWAFRKPRIWQSNWYGAEGFQKVTSLVKNQLDVAMRGPGELAEFLSGQIQNIVDQLEQVGDATARQALVNYMGGKIGLETDNDPATHCIHLFTEYAADTGVTLTLANYLAPTNFKPFTEWLYAKIATISDFMTERGHMFNFSPTLGGSKAYIERHTPKNRLKAYFIAGEFNRINAMAISEVFNRNELKMIDFNAVNYWQSAADPYNITAEVTYNDTTVNITSASVDDLKSAAITTKGTTDRPIMGVLFDEEAVAINIKSEWTQDTGISPATGVNNRFYHLLKQVVNDFSENGVVLMLD